MSPVSQRPSHEIFVFSLREVIPFKNSASSICSRRPTIWKSWGCCSSPKIPTGCLGFGLWLRSPFGLIIKRLWVTMLVSKQEARKTKLEHPDSIHESRNELPHHKTPF